MKKKSGIFQENQFVFAKVKGYSPWPAKITKVIAKSRYRVYFYGTGETGTVKTEDLDVYALKQAKYNSEKQLKKHDYRQAVDQIEAAIAGNDVAPANMDFDQSAADFAMESNDTIPSINESMMNTTEEIQDNPATPPPPPTVSAPTPAPIALQPVKINLPDPEIKENVEEKPNEKKSRSGRTIKEKKMNTDEMDPDEVFTQPRKRIKNDEVKQKVTENNFNEFKASKMHILQDPMKKTQLQRQFEMISATQEIKLVLGLETVDVERAVGLLEEFKESILPQITDIMLLKYPNTVDTMKRLRKYVGNVNQWSWDDIQITKFNEKAEKIRTMADEIFNTFRTIFKFNDESSFWSKFAERQKLFNEKYNALDPEELFEGLTEEDLSEILKSKSSEKIIQSS